MFVTKDDQNTLWAAVQTGSEFNSSVRDCGTAQAPTPCTAYGSLTAVPEPGSLSLLGLGLLSAGRLAHRRLRRV
jgi:hypothetical protein